MFEQFYNSGMNEVTRPFSATVEFYKERPQKINQREVNIMRVIKNAGKFIVAATAVYLTKESVTNGLSNPEIAGGVITGYIGWLTSVFGAARQRAVNSLLPNL